MFSSVEVIMRTLFRKLGQVGWSFPIILALLALCVLSIFAITSATYSNDALRDAPASQTKYIVVGFLVYLALALTPYQVLVKVSPILYAVGVCLLIACYIPHIGKKTFGAYSWIKVGPFGFEPAEFAKLTYILGLAWFLRVRENLQPYLPNHSGTRGATSGLSVLGRRRPPGNGLMIG